jgi:hypothetical protein
MQTVEEALSEIKGMLACLLQREQAKEWYTVAEVATVLGRADYTVRENCRQRRILARKKPCGRNKGGQWQVSRAELSRLLNEGLLPVRRPALDGGDEAGDACRALGNN